MVEFILYEMPYDYSIVLLELFYQPPYPSPVGDVGDVDSSGNMELEDSDLACESK